jgi:DNA-binding MarR family transcriptional regulator
MTRVLQGFAPHLTAEPRVRDLSDDDYASLAQTRRLSRRYQAFSERAAEAAGLEPRQYQLLLMLRGLAPNAQASVSDLADWLQVRHHSAVGLINRTEARGLVQRATDPHDGRRVRVRLTRAGRSALRRLALQHRDELRSIGPGLLETLRQAIATRAALSKPGTEGQRPRRYNDSDAPRGARAGT